LWHALPFVSTMTMAGGGPRVLKSFAPRLGTWSNRWLGHTDFLFYLCAFVIVASLVLGGGTRGGFLSDAILQFLAIPLLLLCLWRLFEVPLTKQIQVPLLFCAAIVAIAIVQLIPLPPWLWTALPGRGPSAETFQILGQKTPWMPISVVPHETWLSALSLIPPLGIFLATILLPYRERRWLSLVFLTVGVVSVFIGMIQVAQGLESSWRFFEITNETEAVGFFANRNHFAALLYALTLFAAAWAVQASVAEFGEGQGRFDTVAIVAMIGAFTLLVVLLAGQIMARSRMGLGLTMVASFGGLALGASDRRVGSSATPGKLLVGAGVLVVIFGVQFALYRVMERFVVDPLEDARLPFARNTVEAALAYMPFGSGLGTFVPVYAMFEKPQDTMADVYANHAHNDVLELWLNTGAIGLILVGMFVVWLVLRSIEIWRSAPPEGASELDWTLARAATLVVALLVAHSLFDYPLRTGAMMAVMAFASALLIEPPLAARRPAQQLAVAPNRTRLPHMPKLAPAAATPQLAAAPTKSPGVPKLAPAAPMAAPPRKFEPTRPQPPNLGSLSHDLRWGTDVDWPEEWSKSPSGGNDKRSSAPKPPKGR
jgi:O-antigen ligase